MRHVGNPLPSKNSATTVRSGKSNMVKRGLGLRILPAWCETFTPTPSTKCQPGASAKCLAHWSSSPSDVAGTRPGSSPSGNSSSCTFFFFLTVCLTNSRLYTTLHVPFCNVVRRCAVSINFVPPSMNMLDVAVHLRAVCGLRRFCRRFAIVNIKLFWLPKPACVRVDAIVGVFCIRHTHQRNAGHLQVGILAIYRKSTSLCKESSK